MRLNIVVRRDSPRSRPLARCHSFLRRSRRPACRGCGAAGEASPAGAADRYRRRPAVAAAAAGGQLLRWTTWATAPAGTAGCFRRRRGPAAAPLSLSLFPVPVPGPCPRCCSCWRRGCCCCGCGGCCGGGCRGSCRAAGLLPRRAAAAGITAAAAASCTRRTRPPSRRFAACSGRTPTPPADPAPGRGGCASRSATRRRPAR